MINKTKSWKRVNTKKKYSTLLGAIADSKATVRNKSTGIKGVYRMINGSYQARININKKEVILISTWDLQEAIQSRKNAENIYYKSVIAKAIENGDFKK